MTILEKDIKEVITESLEAAQEETGVELQIENIYIYGSIIDKENPNDIDIYVKVNVVDSMDLDHDFSEYNLNDEISDGEIQAAELVHNYLHGINQPIYLDLPLDINVKPLEFDMEGLEIDEFFHKQELKAFLIKKQAMQNDSVNKNIYNTPEAVEMFSELAQNQRGLPEIAMLEAQKILGGGVLSFQLEHIGDLTHRMAQRIYVQSGNIENSIENIYPKITNGLNSLQSGYGFEREYNENIKSNYNYYKDREGFFPDHIKSFEDYEMEIERALNTYVREHSKLKVYNQAQFLARNAAIHLGKKEFSECIESLKELKEMIDNKQFIEIASQYDPNFEKNKSKNKFKPH